MVTYGIGVQNRYSAFLDDEDGFANAAGTGSKKAENHQVSLARTTMAKPKSATSATHKSIGTSNSKKLINQVANGRNANQIQQRAVQVNGEQKRRQRDEGKHQRVGQQQQQQQPSQHGANNFVSHKQNSTGLANKGNITNQENSATNQSYNRFGRANHGTNSNHQSIASRQQQHQNKETFDAGAHQRGGKFARNSNKNSQQPQGTNRRQINRGDKIASNGHSDEGNTNLFVAGIGGEEKQRRQQKRALDLKHKDPEKRESRRQQRQNAGSAMEQAGNHAELIGEQASSKAPRGRPQDVPEETVRGGSRGTGVNGGGGRGRRRRTEQASGSAKDSGGERRDGQQQTNQRVPRDGDDRPQRNRNGPGAGSRGSRSTKGDDQSKYGRDLDRQKPIPNFSDKFDFPSLAS